MMAIEKKKNKTKQNKTKTMSYFFYNMNYPFNNSVINNKSGNFFVQEHLTISIIIINYYLLKYS